MVIIQSMISRIPYRYYINFALVASSLVFCVALVEVSYRFYEYTTKPLVNFTPFGEELRPLGQGVYPSGGFVSLDKYGFRNDPNSDPASWSKRILVVGDSLTFGVGVDNNETFVALLNTRYNKQNIGFINTSVPGFDTGRLRSLMLIQAKTHAPIHGVVWVYYINDARTSYKYAPIQYSDDSLIEYPKVVKNFNPGVLKKVSKFTWPYLKSVTFVTNRISVLLSDQPEQSDWEQYYETCLTAYYPGSKSYRIEDGYMKEIAEWLTKSNIPIWFVLAPATDQLTDGRTMPQEFVKLRLAPYSIPVLDLYDKFITLDSPQNYYLENDHAHWNAYGHRLVADQIETFLRDTGL